MYALAAVLCTQTGEVWPETFDDASELIERLRLETGHPAPRLEDVPRRGRPKWQRRRDRELHDQIVAELIG